MRWAASLLVLGLVAGCTPIHLRMGIRPELMTRARDTGAPVVVLQQETSYRIRWSEGWWQVVVEEHQALLLNTEGVADSAHMRVPYVEDMELVRLDARIHLPDGTTRDVSGDAMFDHEIERSGGKDPTVTRSRDFAFPEAVRGSVMEFHYVVSFPIDRLELLTHPPSSAPVLSSRHTVRVPREVLCEAEQEGYVAAPVEQLKHDAVMEYTLARPVPVVGYEPHPDPPGLRLPWLILRCRPPSAVTKLVTGVTVKLTPSSDPAAQWNDLLREVQESSAADIRATAELPLAVTSTTPLEPALVTLVQALEDRVALRSPLGVATRTNMKEVTAEAIGHANTHARLLIATLWRAGIPVSWAVVPTEDQPDPSPNLAWGGLFRGHVLALVESKEGTWWLDPTCRGCPLGLFDPRLQGRGAVVLHLDPKPGQASVQLVEVPWQWAPRGELEQQLTLATGQDSLRIVEGVAYVRGRLAAGLRIWGLDGARPTEALDTRVRRLLGVDLEAGTVTLEAIADRQAVLSVRLADVPLRARGYVATPARTWFSLAELFPIPELEHLGPERQGPVRFETRPAFTRALTLRLAPDERAVATAPAVELQDPMGSYRRTVEEVQEGLHIEEHFVLDVRHVPVAQYPALRAFVAKVLEARRAPFGIERLAP
jgi:hypothetical protein